MTNKFFGPDSDSGSGPDSDVNFWTASKTSPDLLHLSMEGTSSHNVLDILRNMFLDF